MGLKIYPAENSGTKRIEWSFDYMEAYYPPAIMLDSFGDDITSVQKTEEVPETFELSQNYPNPFNPETTIRFSVTKTSNVTLIVFDVLGREVKTLIDKEMYPGTYTVTFDGEDLPSGMYVYRITADGHTETKKLLLLK